MCRHLDPVAGDALIVGAELAPVVGGTVQLQAGWALVDAPQYRGEPLDVVTCLQLPFVPPCRAGVGQWRDQVPGLATVNRAGASENNLEAVIGLAGAKLTYVADQIAHLVDRWSVSVPGGRKERNHAVPADGSTDRPAVRPDATNPHRWTGTLYRGGQQGDVPHLIVPPAMVHRLTRPVPPQQIQALVQSLGQNQLGRLCPRSSRTRLRSVRPGQR